jgi:GrpB-like predicted nucleotidyltransferase (UPF0157 family)
LIHANDEPITIVAYDPSWPTRFEAEKQLVVAALRGRVGDIQHVGSTAVPGLAAKPIIDIMVGVNDLDTAAPCIDLLAALDYCYAPYRPEIMHWFCKPSPHRRTHHLYLLVQGDPEWRARLAFRDFLRQHPETAAEYETLKRRLSRLHENDRDAYTEGKGEFVRRVVRMALPPRSN